MTSISSYQLYQCTDCGQKQVLPIYGTINFMHAPPRMPKPKDIRVCQRCAKEAPLNGFLKLNVLPKPPTDNRPRWLKAIYKLVCKDYQEPEKHPMQLYPELRGEPFNSSTYFDSFIKAHYEKNGYPLWFKELSKPKKS